MRADEETQGETRACSAGHAEGAGWTSEFAADGMQAAASDDRLRGSEPGDTDEEGRSGGRAGDARTPGRPARPRASFRRLRLDRMMSKAELARRAGVSTLTIDRVERGLSCRMDTKRKILEALGLKPQDRLMVFGDDD
jgi:DNA-binding XRE family transcriptional regulator